MPELQMTWGWMVAAYLFLGGIGAGSLIAASVLRLASGRRFTNTVRFGAWASMVAFAVGSFLLLLDVGVPLRAIVLFRSFVRFNSWMAIGAWLLFAGIGIGLLFALSTTRLTSDWIGTRWKWFGRNVESIQRVFSIIGIPLGLGIGAYTGMLLSVLQFRPLWHTWVLPALFVLSALDTGLALIMIYATTKERAEGVERLHYFIEIGVVTIVPLEAIALAGFVLTALNGSADAVLSAELLLHGPLSPYFWALVVALGLGVPLLVCGTRLSGLAKDAPTLPIIGAASCLTGGLALRALVLLAGMPASLTSPALAQFLNGVTFVP